MHGGCWNIHNSDLVDQHQDWVKHLRAFLTARCGGTVAGLTVVLHLLDDILQDHHPPSPPPS